MDWTEIVSTVLKKDTDKVMLAPLSNIAGADIKFDKGYGTIKINVPADVADNLTNGSGKYVSFSTARLGYSLWFYCSVLYREDH